jgi:hypothetical protein
MIHERESQMVDLAKFLQKNKDIKQQNSLYYCRGSRYRVRLPTKLNNDLCRFIGIMHGDGNLSYKRILITDKKKKYHEEVVKPLVEILFNLPLNLFHDENRSSYYSHIKSSVLYRYLIEVLEFQPGSVRCSLTKLPSYLYQLKLENQAYYIAGLYDSEGSIKKRQIEIDFAITTKPIWHFIQTFLRRNGIKFSTRVRTRKKWLPNYEIYIYGREEVTKFTQTVPLLHPAKLKRLERSLTPR